MSRGGQIGTQPANTAIALLAVLGPCGSVPAGASLTLNELTTAAAAFVLRPFLTPGAQLGSTATNTGGLALAVASAQLLVDPASGAAPGAGFPSNGTAPTAKLNTLANLLNGCSASATGASGAGCTNLFAQLSSAGATPPADTLDAALAIANQPGSNVATLYALAAKNTSFQPILAAAPADWMLAVPFTGGGLSQPTAVSVDSAGRVWVANFGDAASLFANSGAPLAASGFTGGGLHESYGGAVDPGDRMWITDEESSAGTNNGYGGLTLLNSQGMLSGPVFSGGVSIPVAIAFDRDGRAWVANTNPGSLTVLDASGVSQSGASGYTSDQLAFPIAVATDSRNNAWVANNSNNTVTRVAPDGSTFTSFVVGNAVAGVAVDAGDNVWSSNYADDSMGLVSSAGQVLSSGGFKGGGLLHPVGVALDGAGTAWVANYRGPGITSLSGASSARPGAAISPAAGWGSDLNLTETFGVAVDAAGSVWVTSLGDNRVIKFLGAAAPVKTPLLGGVRVP